MRSPSTDTRRGLAAAALIGFAALLTPGCGSEPAATASQQTSQQQENSAPASGPRPPLPPMELHPMLDELRNLAAQKALPDEKTRSQLREYGDIALQLVDADGRTQKLVQRSLLEHEHAWFVLEPALTHEDLAVRQRAAWLCGLSQKSVLQVPLLKRLKYELDPRGLIWVADALAKLGNDAGLMWLASAFGREDTANEAGRMAIEALRARGVEVPEEPSWQDLAQLLQEQVDQWSRTGTSSLEDAKAPVEKQLVARLAQHLQTPEGTQLRPVDDARFVLTRLGKVGVPMLVRTLQAEEHYLRTMPLQVLAELGSAARDATDAILPLLADPLTASYAVRALGELGDGKAIPHLRPFLVDRDTELRAAATQALGLLGDKDSQQHLEARLRDNNEQPDVRVRAAFGLLCLGSHQEATAYLDQREAKKDFHEPTLIRLRERLDARAQ